MFQLTKRSIQVIQFLPFQTLRMDLVLSNNAPIFYCGPLQKLLSKRLLWLLNEQQPLVLLNAPMLQLLSTIKPPPPPSLIRRSLIQPLLRQPLLHQSLLSIKPPPPPLLIQWPPIQPPLRLPLLLTKPPLNCH
uniref:(northern house mosquito) hypothetical protein n=1 Tax=Culex pipiens TaxID=7175 RepID=A0A8D8FPI8_CULPI